MQYVEYGPRVSFPGPFKCTDGTFLGLVLKADKGKLEQLVEEKLNKPAAGAETKDPVSYKPLGSFVVMLIGNFEQQESEAPEFLNTGFVSETGAALWLPVSSNRDGRMRLFAPFVLVDNPMSLINGREDYGYAKSMAEFTPPRGIGPKVTVAAYGGNFGQGIKADYDQLLEVVAQNGAAKPAGLATSAAAIAEPCEPEEIVRAHVAKASPELHHEGFLEEVARVWQFVNGLRKGEALQVFLKQFRDASRTGQGCFSQIVEATLNVHPTSIGLSPHPWQVNITPAGSYPIGNELGIPAHYTAHIAFELKMNMTLGKGVTTFPAQAQVTASIDPGAAALVQAGATSPEGEPAPSVPPAGTPTGARSRDLA